MIYTKLLLEPITTWLSSNHYIPFIPVFVHFNSSSQYVKTGDAFGEKANDMKLVRITDDVLDNLLDQ